VGVGRQARGLPRQRDGNWFVACVDLDTMKERIIGPHASAGANERDVVPLYARTGIREIIADLDIITSSLAKKKRLHRGCAKGRRIPMVCENFGDKSRPSSSPS